MSVSSPIDLYYLPPPPKLRFKPDTYEVVVEKLDTVAMDIFNIAGGDDPVAHNNAYRIISRHADWRLLLVGAFFGHSLSKTMLCVLLTAFDVYTEVQLLRQAM